jgi:hypothetical protein
MRLSKLGLIETNQLQIPLFKIEQNKPFFYIFFMNSFALSSEYNSDSDDNIDEVTRLAVEIGETESLHANAV